MDRKNYRLYQISIIPFNSSGSWNAECNTVVMYNQGTQNVTINGVLTLTPGQGWTFAGYPGEMCTQAFDIVFTNDLAAGCNLVITSKEYKQ